ncbi:hypothetical protein HOLleu_27283 [Holothuria leucospilota]|uniref:Uncharacterized protein n=1 Tax=Holothuria leucospilota TaxID=206669 RepID=A0A9Q1H346_HOLLE|nr:hypothetical protein HOLleu_27283 [Holothuria leucospilota]
MRILGKSFRFHLQSERHMLFTLLGLSCACFPSLGLCESPYIVLSSQISAKDAMKG